MMDDHLYLLGYLVGCAVAVALTVVASIAVHVVSWMSKGNICAKNLRKLDPPEVSPAAAYLGVLVLNGILSWLTVLSFLAWQFPVAVFRFVRELVTSTPETIKLLRFPLYNNPHMTAEAVWAQVVALNLAAGADRPTVRSVLEGLDEVKGKVASFHPELAIDQLSFLKAVDTAVIAEVKHWFAQAKTTPEWSDFANLVPPPP